MHTLEATDAQLAQLGTWPEGEPVVMVNLMAFRDESLDGDGDGSGWDAYRRYSAGAVKLIRARGGELMWAGRADAIALGLAGDGDWDYVALVRYPDAGAFVDMMTSADYAAINHHRLNGLRRHLILATSEQYSRRSSD